ncbi:Alpha/Beta hydrolase protein, partial [Endogone sp. FLAS-F59071]
PPPCPLVVFEKLSPPFSLKKKSKTKKPRAKDISTRTMSSKDLDSTTLDVPSTPMSLFDSPRTNQVFLYTKPGKRKSRKIGYAEVGDPNGIPVFCLPGQNGPRQVAVLFDLFARKAGIRLIWPERPGYGLSSNQRIHKNTILEWADIVSQLADSLGIAKFGLFGQSLGAAFAMGVATKIPSRILSPICLISPWVSTTVSNTFGWTRYIPTCFTRAVLRSAFNVAILHERVRQVRKCRPITLPPLVEDEGSEENIGTDSPPAEGDNQQQGGAKPHKKRRTRKFRTIFDPPGQLELCQEMERRVLKENHVSGMVNDSIIALEKRYPFGFSYEDVTLPVRVLWGDRDDLIPHRAVVWMQENILDCDLKVYEGSGHALLMRAGVIEDAFKHFIKAQKAPHRDSGLGLYATFDSHDSA